MSNAILKRKQKKKKKKEIEVKIKIGKNFIIKK